MGGWAIASANAWLGGYEKFSVEDVRDLPGLSRQLLNPSNQVTAYLAQQLSGRTTALLNREAAGGFRPPNTDPHPSSALFWPAGHRGRARLGGEAEPGHQSGDPTGLAVRVGGLFRGEPGDPDQCARARRAAPNGSGGGTESRAAREVILRESGGSPGCGCPKGRGPAWKPVGRRTPRLASNNPRRCTGCCWRTATPPTWRGARHPLALGFGGGLQPPDSGAFAVRAGTFCGGAPLRAGPNVPWTTPARAGNGPA